MHTIEVQYMWYTYEYAYWVVPYYIILYNTLQH